eukprot:4739549-Amphidinium_carterae.1
MNATAPELNFRKRNTHLSHARPSHCPSEAAGITSRRTRQSGHPCSSPAQVSSHHHIKQRNSADKPSESHCSGYDEYDSLEPPKPPNT